MNTSVIILEARRQPIETAKPNVSPVPGPHHLMQATFNRELNNSISPANQLHNVDTSKDDAGGHGARRIGYYCICALHTKGRESGMSPPLLHILLFCSWLIVTKAMHQGVIRDMEQQRLKRERQADFEMQAELEKEYRKVQNVTQDPYAAKTGR